MFKKIYSEHIEFNLKEMRYDGLLKKLNQSFKNKTNQVSKKSGWKKIYFCPICYEINKTKIKNSLNKIKYTKNSTKFIECHQCQILYTDRIPKNLNDVYSDIKYTKFAKSNYLDNSKYRVLRFASERIKLIKKYFKKYKKAKLLDVGCGTGWFIEEANKFVGKVYGLEPGKNLAKNTSLRLGINIFDKDFLKVNFKNKFDIITLFDVIEHVPNPVKYIKKCFKILNKGGIVVIFTPNSDSYGLEVLGTKSTHVCPPDHLFIFNDFCMRKIIEYNNFRLVHYETKGSDIADIYMQVKQGDKDKKVSDFLYKNSDKLQSIIDAANCGNHMRHIIRK